MRLSQLRVVPLPSTAHALSTADHKLTLSQSPTYFEAVELGNIVLLVVGVVGNG
ncbi:hypothetical protein M422DRAFT_28379 [Sphaerobolus stellatus SS14]|nr:hypothetical protein M422DRAFT_28379 [Sphaerobolus stellatus SS14]